MRKRHLGRWLSLAMVAAAGWISGGCLSIGYEKLAPRETDRYDAFVADLADAHPTGMWSWVRGRFNADFDGDLKYAEEAVIVTLQDGSPTKPGPIRTAVLLFCRLGETGVRELVAREIVYERGRTPMPTLPEGVVPPHPEGDGANPAADPNVNFDAVILTAYEGAGLPGRQTVVVKDAAGKETPTERQVRRGVAVVSLSAPAGPRDRVVWHLGYTWPQAPGMPARPLWNARVTQSGAGVWFVNRLPRPAFVVSQRVLPASVAAAIPMSMEIPEWLSVWGLGDDGLYRQEDAAFAAQYAPKQETWLEGYTRALHKGVPAEDVAYLEYYIGRMKRLLKDYEQSADFLERAAANGRNPELKKYALRERERLDSDRKADGEARRK